MFHLIIKTFASPQPYLETWEAMKTFTQGRTADTTDTLWLLEHEPVYTLGLKGHMQHLIHPTLAGNTPIVHCDRGGDITYHGPGQLMLYTLFNPRRLGLSPRQFVSALENTIIMLLAQYDITAYSDPKAPGIYVNGEKIASLGLRIKANGSYHGVALNVKMDLSPFQAINPCGYSGLKMTQIAHFLPDISVEKVKADIVPCLIKMFGYQVESYVTESQY